MTRSSSPTDCDWTSFPPFNAGHDPRAPSRPSQVFLSVSREHCGAGNRRQSHTNASTRLRPCLFGVARYFRAENCHGRGYGFESGRARHSFQQFRRKNGERNARTGVARASQRQGAVPGLIFSTQHSSLSRSELWRPPRDGSESFLADGKNRGHHAFSRQTSWSPGYITAPTGDWPKSLCSQRVACAH